MEDALGLLEEMKAQGAGSLNFSARMRKVYYLVQRLFKGAFEGPFKGGERGEKSSKVPPSNYTLSIMCKLLGRCRRLQQAFDMVASFTQRYGFKANIQALPAACGT